MKYLILAIFALLSFSCSTAKLVKTDLELFFPHSTFKSIPNYPHLYIARDTLTNTTKIIKYNPVENIQPAVYENPYSYYMNTY